ncbi:MAG: DUF4235 domain-containing protein [Nocardioidaceae bacterium]
MSRRTKAAAAAAVSDNTGLSAHGSTNGLSKKQVKKLRKEQEKQPGKRLWKLWGRGTAIAAGIASTQVAALTWRAATGKKPPDSPENPESDVREAIAWAALSGAAIQLAKIVMTRKAAHYWIRSTGKLPPGMKTSTALDIARKDS